MEYIINKGSFVRYTNKYNTDHFTGKVLHVSYDLVTVKTVGDDHNLFDTIPIKQIIGVYDNYYLRSHDYDYNSIGTLDTIKFYPNITEPSPKTELTPDNLEALAKLTHKTHQVYTKLERANTKQSDLQNEYDDLMKNLSAFLKDLDC